jgi:hypothetical protein
MIRQVDIEDAIKSRLSLGGLDWPIAWPNVEIADPPPVPRIEVYNDRNGTEDDGLSGGAPYSLGILRVIVVTETGISTGAANRKADDIAALFYKGLRINIPYGRVVFTGPASIRAGFISGQKWAIPVTVPYRAETA